MSPLIGSLPIHQRPGKEGGVKRDDSAEVLLAFRVAITARVVGISASGPEVTIEPLNGTIFITFR